MSDDLYILCANCGTVASSPAWTAVRRGDDGWWIPDPDCTSEPVVRCPACAYVHYDDDAGPGLYEGTHQSMEAQRSALLGEVSEPYGGNWREWWDEVWDRRANSLIETDAALAGMVDLYRHPESGRVLVEPGTSPADDAIIAAMAALGATA